MVCNLCNSLFTTFEFTNIDSSNLAKMNIENKELVIQNDTNKIKTRIAYCPKCGRSLNKSPTYKNEDVSLIVRKNIENFIKYSSLTPEDIAEKTNILINDILQGKPLLVNELAVISDVLQVPIEYFFKEN